MGNQTAQYLFNENQELVKALQQSYRFLDFTQDQLQRLIELSDYFEFKQGEIILNEGDANEYLFILMDGKVGIYVDGERIAHLGRKGDIFGEMSLITNKPCSATVMVETPVEILRISAADLHESKKDTYELQQSIYRIFSIILAERLSMTNDKAKQFEYTNRKLEEANLALERSNDGLELKVQERTKHLNEKTQELLEANQLLEQKNVALAASYNQIEESNITKDRVLQKLTTISDQALQPLSENLQNLKEKSSSIELSTMALEALRDVERIREMLSPLTSLYQSEQTIQDKRVLLCESNAEQQFLAGMALKGTGVELDIVSSTKEGINRLRDHEYDIVCSNSDLTDVLYVAHKKNPNIETVLMTATNEIHYLDILNQHPYLSNIVYMAPNDRVFTVKNTTVTVKKLLTKDIFGLEKYLNWGVDVQQCPIRSSAERNQLIQDMESYFSNLGLRSRQVNGIAQVAEELLMNAIYDAPVDTDRKAIYNHLPRTVKVELKPNERGTFRYACDGVLVGISVTDPFGAVDQKTIMEYVTGAAVGREVPAHKEFNKAGGGLGLYLIMNKADLVVFNVNPNIKTEVIALFSLDRALSRDIKNSSFHYFLNQ